MKNNIQFPQINKQGTLISKLMIAACTFLLNRFNHTDESHFIKIHNQYGIGVQHLVAFPLYMSAVLWLAVVIPSCLMFYTRIAALHQYLVHMVIIFNSYYIATIICIIYRPQAAALLALTSSVHILEKCMPRTGEHVLCGGARLKDVFQMAALIMILFCWVYLPLHIEHGFDFVTCLFAPEIIGVMVMFSYYMCCGLFILVSDTYQSYY
jgi:hypothetical protein